MTDDITRALLALDVPEDVARQHLARLTSVRAPEVVVPLRRRSAVRAGAAGFVFAATLVSGAGVAAAATAQPGDTLYGLKTARERLQLAMARPGDSRARLELTLARTRLGEAAALLRDGETELAIETLARADAALASAGAHGGPDVDREVEAELHRRVEVLGGLLTGGLPAPAADAAREAIERAVERNDTARRPATPAKPAETPRPSERPGKKPKPADVRPTRPATPSERPQRTEQPAGTEHPTGRPGGKPGRGR